MARSLAGSRTGITAFSQLQINAICPSGSNTAQLYCIYNLKVHFFQLSWRYCILLKTNPLSSVFSNFCCSFIWSEQAYLVLRIVFKSCSLLRIPTLKMIAGKRGSIFVFQVKMLYLMWSCAFYAAVLGKERYSIYTAVLFSLSNRL